MLLDTAGTIIPDYDPETVVSLTKFADQLPLVFGEVCSVHLIWLKNLLSPLHVVTVLNVIYVAKSLSLFMHFKFKQIMVLVLVINEIVVSLACSRDIRVQANTL